MKLVGMRQALDTDITYVIYRDEAGRKHAYRPDKKTYVEFSTAKRGALEFEIIKDPHDQSDHVFGANDGRWWGPINTVPFLKGATATAPFRPSPPAPQAGASIAATSTSAVSPLSTYAVAQGDAVRVTSDGSYPVVGTAGVGPCVAVAIYNQSAKAAVVAHIDQAADIESHFGQLLAHALAGGPQDAPLSMHLCTRSGPPHNLAWDLLVAEAAKYHNVALRTRDVNCGGIAIDSRDGHVYLDVQYASMQHAHVATRSATRVQNSRGGASLGLNAYAV